MCRVDGCQRRESLRCGKMSEKRFTIIGQEYVSFYGGYAQIVSNGTFEFRVWEEEEVAQKICDLLNEQQILIYVLKKARDASDKFITQKGLGTEFLNWCVENE